MTTLIAAVARNGVIGNRNSIPWHLPEDFRHFKAVTQGQVVIMGSRTWESLPKRPLPGRINMVVTSKAAANCPFIPGIADTWFLPSLGEAEFRALTYASKDIFIIGGESIYRQSIETATKLLISEVDMEPEGDTYFPDISPEIWQEVRRDPREGFAIVEYIKRA